MKSYSGLSDFNNLQKRFNTFVGLSEKSLTIESGFERLKANAFLESLAKADQAGTTKNNREMKRRSASLDTIGERWNEALILEDSAKVIPSVEVEKTPRLRGHVLKYSFQYALTKILAALTSVASFAVGTLFNSTPNFRLALYILSAGMFGAFLYKLPYTISILRTIFRFLPIDGGLRQIGRALADALSKAGFIETPSELLNVNVSELDDGSYYLSLQGATFYESSLFADCVDEILSPIDSPRYLVMRKGNFLGQDREDYHAVPLRFGVKKELAEIFHTSWEKYVSPTTLVYTRTDLGRQFLLKAKMKSFSSTFENKIKRLDRWH